MEAQKKYLTQAQLARRLDVAPQTVRSRIENMEIHADATDSCGRLLFLESNVEALKAIVTSQQSRNIIAS